jgi:hypothetical protein
MNDPTGHWGWLAIGLGIAVAAIAVVAAPLLLPTIAVPALVITVAGGIAGGAISGLVVGDIQLLHQAATAPSGTLPSLDSAMDTLEFNMVLGEIGGALSAIPAFGSGAESAMGLAATKMGLRGMGNGAVSGIATAVCVPLVTEAFQATSAKGAEITPQEIDQQHQKDDTEGAAFFHMPVKKYQAWSHKEAVQMTRDRDSWTRNYASRWDAYVASVRPASNWTVQQVVRQQALNDRWRGAYQAMMWR